MKYIIVPILKIFTLIFIFLLFIPLRWAWRILWNFKILGIKESFSITGEYLFNDGFSEWIKMIFSKEATDEFLTD